MSNDLKRVGLIFTQEGAVDFKKTLQDVNLELNKNYNQFKLTQAQWDKTTSSTQKLKAEQEYLTSAYETQSDKVNILKMQLAELENAENKNEKAIKSKRNELLKAETKLLDYKNRLDECQKELTSFGKKLEETGEKIEKVGKKTEKAGKEISAFSAMSVAAMVYAGKSAIDFEDAFTGVEKTVDGTEEQMQKLKQGIRDMAKEIPSTTTEIAAVAEAAGQLGIETDNILGFTRTMIDLGNATNLTAEQAASQLAKFANIMNMSQTDFDKLGSTIVDLGNHFATTEADIVEMAMRLAGAGKQVGLSEGRVLGLATALSSVGIEAEMGGSAISKAMIKMQNAVEISSTKLEDVTKKTGKSLHELQLMSTNDTKGFKELAGSLDMTTTQLKNIVNAGVDLENFAKISGKSTSEFKKQWKEDAAGALTDFIKGLGDAESKGDSAVTMLTEMGLTEVRLRDALLRAANAGDLFNDAIKRGNKAWEDNTALTNEANKRYETVSSKIKIATNKVKDLFITVGNKLLPVIDKGTNFIEKVTKRIDKLNDGQVNTILKIGGIVAAAGPLLTIVGKFISTGGKVIKGVGTFTQAVGVMRGTVVSGSESVNGLAGFLSKLISPAGLATAAVLAAAGAYAYFSQKQYEAEREMREFGEKVQNAKDAQDNWIKSIDDSTGTELAHLDRIKKLKDELIKITDENGRVKDSDKDRAQFILNELNEALGTEYDMNNNIIDSLQDLSSTTDDLILKKKADIIMAGEAKKWESAYNDQTEAINNQEEAYKRIKDAAKMMGDDVPTYLKNVKQAEEDWSNFQNNHGSHTTLMEKYNKAVVDEAAKLISTYDTATERVKKDNEILISYDDKLAKYTEKDYDAIVNTVKTSTDDYTDYSLQKLKESIQKEADELDNHKKVYEDAGIEKARIEMETSENALRTLAENLRQRTSTVSELGEEEKAAWKALAEGNYEVYEEQLIKMGPTMSKNIQEATGVVVNQSPFMVSEAKRMSQQVVDQLDCNEEFRQKAVNDLYGFLNGLNDETLRGLLESAGVNDVERVMAGIRAGNLAESEGVDILKKLNSGLKSDSFKETLFATARGIASRLSSLLNVTGRVNVTGGSSLFSAMNLPGHKSGLDYVPKDNYVARLHEGERVLTKQENKEYTEAEEEAKKHKSSVNIFSGSSDPSLLEAILASNNKVASLLEKLINVSGRKQKIVLDSGALVGETIEDIDEGLGRLEDKRRRGS